MNNLDRKAKLEKALAPSLPNDTIRFADMAWGIQCHADRLAPLHAALLEAVEALEMGAFHHPSCGWYDRKDCHCANLKCKEALAKIDKELEGMGGK